ncbi:multidrug ABC transporter ATP-binding protein [Nitratireductor aestuarii]|uniref:Multidrug ABC transporter ATP-binding protein n=1 Tax=Nitratireductor aestuarii TaxID=1735103 RepID=A0A916RTW9_9HYPH|nr:ABC transporter ATP-binding protein [Nitratireductor aestuarii]GGA70914.1 multidrug ABC transporter ATP-binding protein [Nitratireductor aestuarii]
MKAEEKKSDKAELLWSRAESTIDAFGDTDVPVLPKDAARFIYFFAKQAKGPFLLLLIIGGLVGAVDAGLYWGVGRLIDLLDTASPATLIADHWHELAALALLVLVVRSIVMVANTVIEEQVITPAFYQRVRWQAFRRVMDQPYEFYQNDFAGRIATKIMQGGEATGDFIISILQTTWSFLTFLLLAGTILTALDPLLGVVLALWVGAYLLIARYLLPPLREAGRRRADERSVLSGRMVDAFTNIMAVKLYDSGRREHGYVREGMARLLHASQIAGRAVTRVRGMVFIVNGVMMTAVGAISVMSWMEGNTTSGAIAAAMGLVLRLNQMSGYMMFNINGLIRSYATVQDATTIISQRPAIQDKPAAKVLDHAEGHIRFDNVTFNYGKEGGIIENLNLEILPGERVALVGPSGAGKTTIVNLMLRLFDVEGGRVLLDGNDIRDLTQASLRGQFGVVSQEPILMHRSIRDNIAYGKPGATEEEIIAAARRASAHDFILRVQDPKGRTGYDAHVGERGVKLSGGQRQRIAIARMMLKNAPILILDEATSALDSEIESVIQENLEKLMEGKTVIAIAHRLSTIAALDRVIVLDKGRIVEEGRHEDLLQSGGLYANLWKRQSGGFLVDRIAAE